GWNAAVTQDGKTAACDFDGQGVRLFEIATGRALPSLPAAELVALAFSPDGKHLATLHAGGVVRIWDWAAAKQVLTLDLPVAVNIWTPLGYTPDGNCLLTVARHIADDTPLSPRAIVLWDAKTGKKVRGIPVPVSFDPRQCTLSADGRCLALLGKNGRVMIVNPTDGRQACAFQTTARNAVGALFAGDNSTLF